jgi:hypothetical protein
MKSINPNNFGEKILVENCRSVNIRDILNSYKNKVKKLIIQSSIEAQGLKIKLTQSKTCFNGVRLWFECPICKRRVGILYHHPLNNKLGCRTCLNLDYRKRRYKGMLEENTDSNLKN